MLCRILFMITLNAILLNVVMLSVLAPFSTVLSKILHDSLRVGVPQDLSLLYRLLPYSQIFYPAYKACPVKTL
jgi:hypothetical protein